VDERSSGHSYFSWTGSSPRIPDPDEGSRDHRRNIISWYLDNDIDLAPWHDRHFSLIFHRLFLYTSDSIATERSYTSLPRRIGTNISYGHWTFAVHYLRDWSLLRIVHVRICHCVSDSLDVARNSCASSLSKSNDYLTGLLRVSRSGEQVENAENLLQSLIFSRCDINRVTGWILPVRLKLYLVSM